MPGGGELDRFVVGHRELGDVEGRGLKGDGVSLLVSPRPQGELYIWLFLLWLSYRVELVMSPVWVLG